MGCKNILLITSDQQHYNTIGINNPEIETPKPRPSGKAGHAFFPRILPQSDLHADPCFPVLPGLYPSQHGAWTLGTKLPECVPTIGDYLNKEATKLP